MALYLSRAEGASERHRLRRVVVAWEVDGDEAELVLEPARGGQLRLVVEIGGEREVHELGGSITTESKLITIEETGASLPESEARKPQPPPVKQHSKLITIEDTRGSLPDVTIVVP